MVFWSLPVGKQNVQFWELGKISRLNKKKKQKNGKKRKILPNRHGEQVKIFIFEGETNWRLPAPEELEEHSKEGTKTPRAMDLTSWENNFNGDFIFFVVRIIELIMREGERVFNQKKKKKTQK